MHRVTSVVSHSLQPCRLWPARVLCQGGVLQARILEHIGQYWFHTHQEHYISCCPSCQLSWVPGAARTPVTQAAAPPPHLAIKGQTQVLQGSLRSKPQWTTHMQFSTVKSLSSVRLRPQGLQQARPLCPLPTSRVYPNSCLLNQWYHPTMSTSVVPFSTCPQSSPASVSLQISQFFASGGQSIGVPASTSVLPMNIQDLFPLWLTGLILQSKGLLQHPSSKASILWLSAFFTVKPSYPYMTSGKTIALTRWTFVGKAMSLLFNMLSGLVITFLPRSKHLLISWLQSHAEVEVKPQLKPRSSVTKEEGPKPSNQLYKLWIKSTWSTRQTLCLWNI